MIELKGLRQKTQNLSVLLVDDEDKILEMTALLFKKFFKTVETASNGEEALEIYHSKEDSIDIVISDFNMPYMNGIKLFETLRSEKTSAHLIIMTGMVEDIQAYEKLYDYHLEKPVKMDTLVSVLENVTRNIKK